tara:strand:+ start:433 stop:1512 length:1080 start_codon:yes stop_codon:yes gene_type:complete
MFVADLHNDLVQRIMIGEDLTKSTKFGHSDIPRLKKSIIDLEVLIVWVSDDLQGLGFFETAKKMYDKIYDLIDDDIVVPNSLSEILEAKSNNKLLLPIAIEGGEAIENKIENLHYFIERGIFYLGPTWNHSLDWVSSAYDETYNKSKLKCYGLNDFGLEVIKTCEENKVLIDVSHIGEKSFWDIVSVSTKPFIASHSSAYNLCPHFRNLKNDQIIAIKEKKGLIGINPYPFFIEPHFEKKAKEFKNKIFNDIKNIENKNKTKAEKWLSKQHYMQKKFNSITPKIDVFIDHIDYVVKLVGIDYVGIGSDYDGLDCLPHNWKDCEDHILIVEKLVSRGYKHKEIEKVMGNNILRVLEEIDC